MATTAYDKMSGQQDESIPEDMVIDPSKPIDSVQDRNQQVPGTGTQHPAPPTQNILGDYGKQANNCGTQLRPKYTFSQTTPAPAPAPMPTTAPAPAPALAHTSGTQNIQGNYGEQANNAGNQDDPTFDFAGQGTQTPANNSGT
uniref:Uncharacterized protein n=1 Tax=Picea sitchensis TaxID=3332 RepID=A9NPL7_PICSI|nr:unknown [Picea sitchensis]ABK26776.1 unknown [Picea sitchensis]ACN40594.1 unknown [Picea sitchensis]